MKKTYKKIVVFVLAVLLICPVTYRAWNVQAASAVKLSKKKLTLEVGAKKTLKVTGTKKEVTWSTSKKSVASVSKKGVVTAKKAGKAVITAKVGKKEYKCQVTVIETSLVSEAAEGTRAVIAINGKEYGMTITDTTVGRAFAKKLQDEGAYTITGYRSTDDICCSESESLETDPAENMPWVCGGVAWFDGWFTIWVSEGDSGRIRPVVAQIDEEYSEELQALRGDMEIEVRLTGK